MNRISHILITVWLDVNNSLFYPLLYEFKSATVKVFSVLKVLRIWLFRALGIKFKLLSISN